MIDGCEANVYLDLRVQGDDVKHINKSIVERDRFGFDQCIGETLKKKLFETGAMYISGYIVKDAEEPFYESLGVRDNKDCRPFHTHRRLCVPLNRIIK